MSRAAPGMWMWLSARLAIRCRAVNAAAGWTCLPNAVGIRKQYKTLAHSGRFTVAARTAGVATRGSAWTVTATGARLPPNRFACFAPRPPRAMGVRAQTPATAAPGLGASIYRAAIRRTGPAKPTARPTHHGGIRRCSPACGGTAPRTPGLGAGPLHGKSRNSTCGKTGSEPEAARPRA